MSTKSRKGRTIGRPGRHGGYSLLTRGILPERRKYIGHYLTAVREGLIHDLAAAEEDLSMAQRILIDRVITFLGVVRLIEEHARDHGILDAKGELTSGLTHHYLSFNRHIKDTLALLGLDRKEAPEPTLEGIIREFDAKKRTRIAQDGRSQGQRQTVGEMEGIGQAEIQGGDRPENGEEPAEAGQEEAGKG